MGVKPLAIQTQNPPINRVPIVNSIATVNPPVTTIIPTNPQISRVNIPKSIITQPRIGNVLYNQGSLVVPQPRIVNTPYAQASIPVYAQGSVPATNIVQSAMPVQPISQILPTAQSSLPVFKQATMQVPGAFPNVNQLENINYPGMRMNGPYAYNSSTYRSNLGRNIHRNVGRNIPMEILPAAGHQYSSRTYNARRL